MAKRLMCIIISVLMIVSLLPTGAFADSSGDTGGTQVADSSTDGTGSETMDEEDSSNNKGGGTDETEDAEESISLTSANDGESIVATVGEVSYTSLSEAISAANGSAVVLQSDVTLTASSDYSNELYISSGTVVIDLNGHNIDGGSITYPIYVASGATLTISDSSSSVGTITLAGTYGIYCLGTLNITGGNISSSSSSAAIYVYGGTLNMTGGSVTTSSSTGVWLNNATSASLSDCTIKTTYSGWGYAVYCSSCTGAVSLTNVTIDASSTNCCGLALLTYTEATLTNCSIHTNGWYCIANNGADSKVELTINGGTYTADDCTALYLPNYNATTTISNATITGACGIEIRGGTLTLTDCTVTGNNSSYIWQSSGSGNTVYGPAIAISQHTTKQNISVTINGGTYSATNAPAVAQLNLNSATSEDVSKISLSVYSGSFTGYSSVEGTDTAIELASVETSSSSDSDVTGMTVSISGGTYSSDVSEYVAKGYTYNSDGTVTTAQVASVTSSDGTTTTTYASLAEAVSAASSGDTVTLLSNVTLTDTVKIYKSITLDLGDYTITGPDDDVTAIYSTQALTVTADKGGITASGVAIMNQKGDGAGTLTIQGGTYTSSGAHAIYNIKGTVTVESGTITSTASSKDGICSAENDTAEGYDQADDSATVIVKGGTITGTRYGIYSTHDVQISGGSITGTTVGVYLEDGSATISGGTINGYEGLKSGSKEITITITGGTFEGVTHAVYALSDTVNVSGGTFTATGTKDQYAVALYSNGATITVTGGTFTGMYSTAWINSSSSGTIEVPEGYIVDTGEKLTAGNSSDTVAVTRTVLKAVAMVDSTYYATLADAVTAASSGDKVTLLADCTVDALITVSTTVELDLNGCSVTPDTGYTGTNMFAVASGGSLTISDSGEDGNITATNRAILVYSGGTLNVTDGTIHGDSIGIFSNGGTVTVSGGAVSCYDTSSNGTYTSYSAIYCDTTSGGSLSITGGEISGYRGIINWGSDVTISNGTVSAASAACAIQQTGGSLTISGGTVTNTGTGQAIFISQGASATISGGTITAPYEDYGVGVLIQKGSLTMTGGSVYGHNFGIGTNGTNSDSYYPNTIEISGGTVSGTYGMYLPAVSSKTTISGTAEITGTSTGIEIRAGELIVESSATIKSTSETFSLKTNGSGATVTGAGIAISQHSTNQTVTVTIKDGTISGYYGVYEWNTYENNTSEVSLAISGDTTVTATGSDGEAVYSKSVSESANAYTTVSISGGTYSTEVAAEYCAEDYAPVTTPDSTGYYTVTNAVVKGYDSDDEYVAGYATLADALADESEDVVKLVLVDSDTVSTNATATKTLTIDLGGNNLTINSDATLTVASAATVTIVDNGEAKGLVTNNGTIAVEGTLDIRDLGYTTDSSGSGLLGQLDGKITLGSSSTFIVPDVWNTMWGSVWEPTWNSAANIMSSVTAGARVISFGKVWECTTGFSNLTTYNDSGDSYWSATGTYLVEYFKTSRGGSGIDSATAETWTYPTSDDSNMIFAGWYSDSTYGTVYDATSGEATAKFVKLFYDKTTAEDGDTAAVINFIGGSLRNDGDATSTSLRFGYEIIIPEDFERLSWSWSWSTTDGSSGTVKGQYYSSTTILSNEDIGTDKIRTNLVITDIPSTAYSTNFNSTLIVKFVTGDGTTVEAKSSTSTRTVDGVAYAVINDSDADDDDQSYAESIYKVTHTDYSGSNS